MLFHYTKHEEEDSMEELVCSECNMTFRKKAKLDKHMEKQHGGPHECEHCNRWDIMEHLQTSSIKLHIKICTNLF